MKKKDKSWLDGYTLVQFWTFMFLIALSVGYVFGGGLQ